jgi:hypothetical protein
MARGCDGILYPIYVRDGRRGQTVLSLGQDPFMAMQTLRGLSGNFIVSPIIYCIAVMVFKLGSVFIKVLCNMAIAGILLPISHCVCMEKVP